MQKGMFMMIKTLRNAYRKEQGSPLKKAVKILNTDDSQTLIEAHALAAMTANFGLSHLPVVGGAGALGTLIFLNYHMYDRINKSLGIRLRGNIRAVLPRIILSNISGNLGAVLSILIASAFTSNIPGVNTVAAVEVAAATFSSLYTAGLVYDETMKRVAARAESMSADDWKKAVADTTGNMDISSISKNAYDRYVSAD